ncbi:MAG TPA: M48 family metalloprotease [Thermoanaerobaculia bacterium]|jgi:predicted Zn-dependent protease
MDPHERRSRAASRLLTVSIMALVAVVGYYGIRGYNPVLPAVIQRLRITPQQEIAIGLQAAPAMAQRYGGLSADPQARQRVDRICHDLVEKTDARRSPYDFDCHVLADTQAVDAFALPGGQVFVTAGLMERFPSDAGLAGVLGHEIGHVLARHGTERIAEARIAPGMTGAAVLAAYDPADPASRRKAAVATLIGRLIDLRFTPREEAEADRLGARLAVQAGFDPRAAAQAMQLLEAASDGRGARGGGT